MRGKGQKKIDLYNADLKNSLEEMFRVLKPKKYAVIIIGNATYLGQEVKNDRYGKCKENHIPTEWIDRLGVPPILQPFLFHCLENQWIKHSRN